MCDVVQYDITRETCIKYLIIQDRKSRFVMFVLINIQISIYTVRILLVFIRVGTILLKASTGCPEKSTPSSIN